MAISLNTKDSNLFNEMHRVVSVYAADPDHVLRRRFTRLHFYNLYQKHKHLVKLDEKISTLERDLAGTNARQDYASSTQQGSETLDDLLLEVDKRLRDFGKP
jgi:predicted dithiol-disulfide oxidoreductase (DUF899 family)